MHSAEQDAKGAIARGDFAAAYDLTVSAIAAGDESIGVRHQQVLALARMGDTELASALYAVYGLDRSEEPDERAVGARLLKDRAFQTRGRARAAAMSVAADAYRAVFELSGALRPGVNYASLAFLGGRIEEARDMARRLLMNPDMLRAGGGERGASRKAELLLLLGRIDQAEVALASSGTRPVAAAADRASSARQLGAIAAAIGLDAARTESLLRTVRAPAAIHFAGPSFLPDATAEGPIAEAIAALLAARDVGFAYGSLAAGSELLVAEAVLARGAELHVVLPFDEADFIAHAVRPAGAAWVDRYRAAMAAAASRTQASDLGYIGDPAQYDYAGRVAMGLARLKARQLGADVFQLALAADDEPATARTWQACGGETVAVAAAGVATAFARPQPPAGSGEVRTMAAILFTDFPGFSKLSEAALPAFWNGVMRRVADVLDAHGDAVECRNAWGDALYAVTQSAAVSAEIALSLQGALATFDYGSLGLRASMGMRIGAHFGTAYRAIDHITGRISFYGSEVSRAARIEPVTPPGAVFVTEPFAAMLMLEAPDRFVTRYVGRIDLAKGAGSAPMYRLTRA